MKKLLIAFVISFNCYAGYISALPNNNLYNEIKNQEDRLIPSSDWFNAAIDGRVYFRGLGNTSFYHGGGHWTQLRTESRIQKFFSLNTRSVFYTGSNSNGYSFGNYNYHLFSFKAQLPLDNKDWQVFARARDLERKSIGRGLILQDKEMVGIELSVKYKDLFHKVL